MPRLVMQVAMAAAAVRAAADAAKVCKKSICGDDIHALIINSVAKDDPYPYPFISNMSLQKEKRFLFAMKLTKSEVAQRDRQ